MKSALDKENIVLAIDNYNVLSDSQKNILKVLVSFNHPVPADILMELSSLSKQAFHFSMKKLLVQNFVCREKIRIYLYKENEEKLLEMLEVYNQQKLFQDTKN